MSRKKPTYEQLEKKVRELEKAKTKSRKAEEGNIYLGQILENSLNEIYIFDSETLRFLMVNKGARENLGYSTEELKKLTPLDLKPEFTPETFAGLIQPLRDGTESKVRFSTVHRRKDGSLYLVEIHLQIGFYDNRAVFVVIILDITERKGAEEAVRESELKYRTLFDGISDAIFIHDLEGRFIEVNQVAWKRYGYSREELLKMSVKDIGTPEQASKIPGNFKKLLELGNIIFESAQRKRNGEIVPVEINARMIKFRGEQAVLSVCRDITERKEAEEALRERTYALRERVKELNCLYGLSQLSEQPEISLDEIFQGTVDIIPPSWQYSEITCGRIQIEGKIFKTGFFKKTKWKQAADIKVYGEKVGTIEVYYSKEMPEIDEGPFLKEERHLINSVAGRLGKIIERKQSEDAFQALVKTAVGFIGQNFFEAVVADIGEWLETDCVLIGAIDSKNVVNSLAMRLDGKSIADFSYNLEATPCENVTQKGFCHYPDNICEHFPEDKMLIKMGVRGYVGVPLLDDNGKALGILAALSRKKLSLKPRTNEVMSILAARVSAELKRVQADEALQKAHHLLEIKVKERTQKLTATNKKMRGEIIERKNAEKTLEAERNYLSRLHNSIGDAIFTVKLPDRTIEYVNSAVRTIFGYSPMECISNSTRMFYPDEEHYLEFAGRIKSAHERSEDIIHDELLLKKKNGEIFPAAITSSFLRENGKVTGIISIVRDISERKQAGELLAKQAMEAILLHRTTEIAAEDDSFEDALQRCVNLVCELTGWPVGHVYFLSEELDELVSADIWHLADEKFYKKFRKVTERTSFKKGKGLPGRIWASGEAAWIVDVNKDDNFTRAKLAKSIGVKGAFGFPIKIKGELVAVLEFFTEEEMVLNPQMLRTAKSLGKQIGRVLERKRAEDEIRQLAKFPDENPQPILRVATGGTIDYANQAASGLLETWDCGVGRYLPERYRKIVAEAYRSGREHSVDVEDLRGLTFTLNFAPVPGLKYVNVYGMDITERKRAEEELKEEQEKLKKKLHEESVLAAVAARLNNSQTFEGELDDILRTIGQKMGLDGVSFYIIEPDQKSAVLLNSWCNKKCNADGCGRLQHVSTALHFFKALLKGGPYVFSNNSELDRETLGFFNCRQEVDALVCPLSMTGQLKGFISFGKPFPYRWSRDEIDLYQTMSDMLVSAWERDMHQQARLEAERQHTEAVQLAERASRLASIGTVAAGITHEINQPLNRIILIADSAVIKAETAKALSREEVVDKFKSVSQNVIRIAEIINHMREFWVSPTHVTLSFFDLNEAVKKAMSLVEQQLFSHGIEQELALEATSMPVRGSIIHLEQIVINVVMNAMHALDGVERQDKKIRVTTRLEKKFVVLEVKDNGTGFVEDDKEKLFDPFYSTKKPGEGTGLGLAIVQKFVEGFDGTIRAMNNEVGGATFTMEIPITQST